jgi:uncharacterized OB-fold protein
MMLQHCVTCRTAQFHPRPICATCGSDDLVEVEAIGSGTVDSFTIVHHTEEPYVLARVRLTEGPIVLTHCDQPVRLVPGSDPQVFTE